jgi:hypothetical protein
LGEGSWLLESEKESKIGMEKKSLEDISRTFMTPEEESIPGESSPIFFSTPVREESCSACFKVIEQPPGPLKCKIFSYKNKEYGGLVLESIMPGYAKYCRYFEPLAAGEVDNKKDIEKIDKDDIQYSMQVEETINSQKKIMFNDDGNLQNNLKKMLSEHLEMGYEIVRIDLEMKEEIEDPAYRKRRYEKVTIFKKDPPSIS